MNRHTITLKHRIWSHFLVWVAAPTILVGSCLLIAGCILGGIVVSAAMVLLSLVLHPLLLKLGRYGMWRQEGPKLVLALDRKAFQKI